MPAVQIMHVWNNRRRRRRTIAPVSHEKNAVHIAAFGKFFGEVTLDEVTPGALDAWIDYGLGHLTPNSVIRYTTTIRSAWAWAVKEELAGRDPWIHVEPPKETKSRPRWISDELASRLVQAAGPRPRVMILLGLHCGLRISETAGLHRTDWLSDERLLLVTGKGQKDRTLPVPPECADALDEWTAGMRPYGPMWPPARGARTNIRSGHAGACVVAVSHTIGCHVTPHQLRHTFAIRHVLAGTPLPVLQALLGHESLATTQIYADAAGLDLGRWTIDQRYLT